MGTHDASEPEKVYDPGRYRTMDDERERAAQTRLVVEKPEPVSEPVPASVPPGVVERVKRALGFGKVPGDGAFAYRPPSEPRA